MHLKQQIEAVKENISKEHMERSLAASGSLGSPGSGHWKEWKNEFLFAKGWSDICFPNEREHGNGSSQRSRGIQPSRLFIYTYIYIYIYMMTGLPGMTHTVKATTNFVKWGPFSTVSRSRLGVVERFEKFQALWNPTLNLSI